MLAKIWETDPLISSRWGQKLTQLLWKLTICDILSKLNMHKDFSGGPVVREFACHMPRQQPVSHNYWSWCTPRNKKPLHWAHTQQTVAPAHILEKTHAQQQRPSNSQKLKQMEKKSKHAHILPVQPFYLWVFYKNTHVSQVSNIQKVTYIQRLFVVEMLMTEKVWGLWRAGWINNESIWITQLAQGVKKWGSSTCVAM